MNNQLARTALSVLISMAMMMPEMALAQTAISHGVHTAANGLPDKASGAYDLAQEPNEREERRIRMRIEREQHQAERKDKAAEEARLKQEIQAAKKNKKSKNHIRNEVNSKTDNQAQRLITNISPEQLTFQLSEKLRAQEDAEREAKARAEKLREDSLRLKQQVENINAQVEAKAKAEAEAKEKNRLDREVKEKEAAERKAREEAARQRAERERIERIEAIKKAAAEEQQKTKAQAEFKSKLEAQLKANQEAEKKAFEAAENLRIENERIALDLKKAKAEAERKTEAERQARLEAERQARIEAERKAEAERQAKAETERKAEAARQAKAEADRQARIEAARQAQAEVARLKAEQERRAEEVRQAKFEQELHEREEADRKKAERLKLAQEARQQKIEQDARDKAEREDRIKQAAQNRLDSAARIKAEKQKLALESQQEAQRQKEAALQIRASARNEPVEYNPLQKIMTPAVDSIPAQQSTYAVRSRQSALQVATAKIAGVYQSPLRAQYLGYTASETQMSELHKRTKYDASRLSVLPRAIGEIQLLPVARLAGDSIVMFKTPEDKKMVEEFLSYYPLHAQVFGNYIKRIMTLRDGKTGGASIDRAIMEELTYDISVSPVPSSSLSNAQDTYLYFSSRLADEDQVKFWNWINAVKQNDEIRVPSWIRLADVIYSQ